MAFNPLEKVRKQNEEPYSHKCDAIFQNKLLYRISSDIGASEISRGVVEMPLLCRMRYCWHVCSVDEDFCQFFSESFGIPGWSAGNVPSNSLQQNSVNQVMA